METVDVVHRRGREPIWIFITEVRLLHERELAEIGKRYKISWLDAFLVATASKKRYAFVFIGNEFLKLGELEGAKFRARHVIGL